MVGNEYRLVILMGAFTILGSLLVETRSLNSFWNHSPHPQTATTRTSTKKMDHCAAAEPAISNNYNRIFSIPIELNSTIATDVPRIWHDSDQQAICVALQDARCPRPALLGRLSGPALALLEWKHHPVDYNNDDDNVLCGSYKDQWLDAGTYFVEIIVLFCNDFGPNSHVRTENESAWLSYNFQPDCMEDPTNNRITGTNAFVKIEQSYITYIV